MRTHPYPALDALRQTESHPLPMGVTLERCALCHQPILDHDDALSYQRTKNGPAMMAHQQCTVDDLSSILRAVGKYGMKALRVLR